MLEWARREAFGMTLEHLKYFLAAASYLNFSKAADSLFIHQTTMTRAIANLEEEFGGALFIRMKYSLQLTQLGLMLREEAQPLIDASEKMLTKIKTEAGCVTGSLSLLAPSVYVPTLSRAYANFYAKYPKVVFSVDSCPYGKLGLLCESVLDGTVDLGIVFSQNIPDDTASLSFFKICSDRQCLALPMKHPLARKKSVKVSELADTPFLLGDHMGKSVLKQISSILLNPPRGNSITYSAGEALLLQFSAGMGMTFMPSRMAASDNFICVDIEDVDMSFNIFLVWNEKNSNPALLSFLGMLHNFPPQLLSSD